MTLEWDGDKITAAIEGGAESALTVAGEVLLDESNRRAPIETGALIRSGVVIAEGTEAAVGYTSVYAARQHEEIGWSHDAGRQAKYLETALTGNADRLEHTIATQLSKHLGGNS
ncbi:hypothetical protein [Gordonia sihwensis]|uniref:hypothetical protein n=1 Tax=Gordonia sihwensis TaxID=173559 RepID=UPI002415BFBC|nr:hypothetical protein [Gordonia sihwensis]WFN91481.1 hypothetical protein P5P27_11880 [Gordonia sihwensis]WFN91539.1 hypothetical protein P5P27_12170 [Gordonia sihwensis]